jgi:hypothetical protein
LKRYKSPGINKILAGLIHAGCKTSLSEICKLSNSIWNKKELPQQWKKSIIIPIYQEGDKTDCSNYRGMSLLPTTYNIFANILPSRLTAYLDKIIGDCHCGFGCKTSSTDVIHSFYQILRRNGSTVGQYISYLKS